MSAAAGVYDQLGVPGASSVQVPVPSAAVQRCRRHGVRSLCDGSPATVTAVPATGEASPPAKLAVAAVAAVAAPLAATAAEVGV